MAAAKTRRLCPFRPDGNSRQRRRPGHNDHVGPDNFHYRLQQLDPVVGARADPLYCVIVPGPMMTQNTESFANTNLGQVLENLNSCASPFVRLDMNDVVAAELNCVTVNFTAEPKRHLQKTNCNFLPIWAALERIRIGSRRRKPGSMGGELTITRVFVWEGLKGG